MSKRIYLKTILAVMIAVVCFGSPAVADQVPRILLVGDSWTGFLWAFRSFETVLDEYPGLGQFTEMGGSTAIMGAKVCEYRQPENLNRLVNELESYPTVDVVVMTFGGNDFLRGSDSAGGLEWEPDLTPQEEQQLNDAIAADIEFVIDTVLAVRPNLRVAICGYSYTGREMSGATILQMNQGLMGMEAAKRDLALAKERVEYVHNFGLMQYAYGIPAGGIPPETVPYPGGIAGNYVPWPGGNPDYNAPLESLIDNDIHLTGEGYQIVARRVLDEAAAAWLDYPCVVEIVELGAKSGEYLFQVTFSEAVTGVDDSDFAVSLDGGTATAALAGGSGAVYTVAVSAAGGAGVPVLEVVDDDTIVDGMGNPLGGPGAGNGGFAHNGVFSYVNPVPPPETGFDAALSDMQSKLSPYMYLLGADLSFAPAECDINGDLNLDFDNEVYDIGGNGLLDSAEFALIRACLDGPALDFTSLGGVSHEIAQAAWDQNFAQMYSDLGGEGSLASIVLPGMDTMMAGFMTLGDNKSTTLVFLLMVALAGVEDFPINIMPPNVGAYATLPEYFAFDGDADGDGYTNQEEYAFFMPLGGKDGYAAAALNPDLTPGYDCTNSTGGTFNEGDYLCLFVPGPVAPDSAYQWYKDGEPMVEQAHAGGTFTRQLTFFALQPSDSGSYTCAYDDGSKAAAVFGPVEVTVTEQQVPATGGMGLALLALFTAVGGGTALYRRG